MPSMTTERTSGHSARGIGAPLGCRRPASPSCRDGRRRGTARSRVGAPGNGVRRGDADDVEAFAPARRRRGRPSRGRIGVRSRGRRSAPPAACRGPCRPGAARKDGRDFIRMYHSFACCVLVPWHVAEIVDRRQFGRGGEVGEAKVVARPASSAGRPDSRYSADDSGCWPGRRGSPPHPAGRRRRPRSSGA